MSLTLAIAGGGIGGLATALACTRAGSGSHVLEQAHALSETGAGVQLGPNVTRILEAWSLGPALRACACEPEALVVRDAADCRELARLDLGADFARRYGAPYLTLHRADLQQVLLRAVEDAGVPLTLGARVASVHAADRVHAQLGDGGQLDADALVIADGVWSSLRAQVLGDAPARPTGHLAYRALALQSSLPAALRSNIITLWLAPRMHIVSYPVRRGEQLNVVALVESARHAPAQGWDAVGGDAELLAMMSATCGTLHQLVEAMPGWGLWSLHARDPVAGPQQMARGRVALLGDAAHPMLPYLAQGAGMAIEDAAVLATVLSDAAPASVPAALERYAQARWRRCAQVQVRARRNAAIFHANGVVKFARDAALRMRGDKLLDQPWLYAR
jgi:salicylate hydroxylase